MVLKTCAERESHYASRVDYDLNPVLRSDPCPAVGSNTSETFSGLCTTTHEDYLNRPVAMECIEDKQTCFLNVDTYTLIIIGVFGLSQSSATHKPAKCAPLIN